MTFKDGIKHLGSTLYMLWGGNGRMGEDGCSFGTVVDKLPWMGRVERVALLESLLAYHFPTIDLNAFKAWFAERHGGWFDVNGNLPCLSMYAYNFAFELEKFFDEGLQQKKAALLEEQSSLEAKAAEQEESLSRERCHIEVALADLEQLPHRHTR